MPFDIALAIAALDLSSGDRPNLEPLRGRYPELGFVFDLLEDSWDEADQAAIAHRDEMRERERGHDAEVCELEERIDQYRLGLMQIQDWTLDVDILSIVDDLL